MLWTTLVAATLVCGPPEPGEERGIVELGVAAAVLYPPAIKDPRVHPAYAARVSASLHGKSRFKAMLGFGFDHIVQGWLGEPGTLHVPRNGRWVGTLPQDFRGQLFRMTPSVRLGLENEIAYGYFGATPGYALRVAPLACVNAPCRRDRAVDHGLNLGVSLGAMANVLPRFGLVVGGEVGLDWAWFPSGHPALAVWSQGMAARFIVGRRF